MEFKQWFENLSLQQTIAPDDRWKHIWINQPNNLQQINSWQKINTKKIFDFPLNKDTFIHFTTPENAEKILSDNKFSGNYNFAVSLSFGHWKPVVQFNHVIAKKDQKFLMPHELRKKDVSKKIASGRQVPEFSKELVAIIFKTNNKPKDATGEEVVWDGPVDFINARIIPVRDGIRLLKKTPYGEQMKSSFNNSVNYV